MTKRQALMLVDSSMLLSLVVLISWRLSGITAHEWIGFALIALILAHLLVHWGWVESSVAGTPRHERRGRVIPLGGARFLFSLVVLSIATVIGRRVLGLRLNGPQGDRGSTNAAIPSRTAIPFA
jgi:hypothetical protein